MAINFPSSPTSGDTYVYGDFTYAYDGEKWTSQGTVDEEYVKKSGDIMSGNLYLNTASAPEVVFQHEAGPQIASMGLRDDGHFFVYHSDTGTEVIKFEGGSVKLTFPSATSVQGQAPGDLTRKDYVDASIPTRKKSEVHYTGLNVVLTAGVATNIITALNGLPVSSGTWLPMFDSTTGKLTPFNDDRSVTFKLNLMGTFDGGSTNRALQLDFTGTVGNRIVVMRDSNITPSPNSIQFATFFSVDRDGNMATNGTEPMVTALGGNFTITEALIIAEQVTTEG